MSLRCSVYIAVSLDGYIARKDDRLDWLDRVQREGEDYGYAAFMSTIDVLVMGRRTYDVVRSFASWPYAGKRVVVLTSNATLEVRDGVERASGPLSEIVKRYEGRAYIDGGETVRSFLKEGLVDDLTLSIVPVILGSGIPLFASGLPERSLELEESRAFPSGLVQSRYRVKP